MLLWLVKEKKHSSSHNNGTERTLVVILCKKQKYRHTSSLLSHKERFRELTCVVLMVVKYGNAPTWPPPRHSWVSMLSSSPSPPSSRASSSSSFLSGGFSYAFSDGVTITPSHVDISVARSATTVRLVLFIHVIAHTGSICGITGRYIKHATQCPRWWKVMICLFWTRRL